MNPQQLTFHELSADPFDKSIADDQLWLPPSKMALVEGLCDTITARRWALLTGDPGVGKTCVLRALRHRLGQDGFKLTYCSNATLGRRDFYRQLCHALGLLPQATAAGVFHALTTHVQEISRENIHPVFLIDEAQLLHQDVLDHLHILGNYEWDSAPLLTIVLIGLPELEDRLSHRRNRSLYARIFGRYRVGTMRLEDTADYLRNRLALVGANHERFASDAVGLLHEVCNGTMRDIDRIASASMAHAARKKSRIIERAHVQLAQRDDAHRPPAVLNA